MYLAFFGSVKTMDIATPRILRLPDVQLLVGLSRSEIYRRMTLKEFPKSISLGKRSVGWLESEILSWIGERIAASRAEHVLLKNAA